MGRKDDPRAFGCDMRVCNEEEELSNTLQTKVNSLNSTNPVLHQAETAEDNAVTIHDGTRWIVRRLTPLECERLQGFPSVVHLEVENMTSDDLIACAIANEDIVCDFDAGKVYGTRGPGGVKLGKLRELGFKHPSGYIHINLSANGFKKQVRAHRVIYIAAHGGIPDGLIVDHINGIKDDNRLSNLQLLSPEDNSHKAKEDGAYQWISDPEQNKRMLPYEVRSEIFHFYQTSGMSYSQLAEKYGCSKTTIANIISESDWTLIPWKGKPAEECPDGVRYKAIGNSMAVPTMLWLGSRLQEVEERYGADNRQATQDA